MWWCTIKWNSLQFAYIDAQIESLDTSYHKLCISFIYSFYFIRFLSLIALVSFIVVTKIHIYQILSGVLLWLIYYTFVNLLSCFKFESLF